MSIRIQVSSATVKALHNRLQAYLKDDVRLVRRTTVLIDFLVHLVPVAVLCERWGLSASLSLRLAKGLSAAWPGQLGLPPWWRAPREVDSQAEETLG